MQKNIFKKVLSIGIIILFLGASFVPIISGDPLVSEIGLGTLRLRYPERKLVRTSDGVLHCVYHRSDGLYTQIYHSYSSDNGETWTEEAVTSGSYNQEYPVIAVDSNDNIHLVWAGYHSGSSTVIQIRYCMKTSSGWQAIQELTNEIYPQNQAQAIAIDSQDYVHVVWSGQAGLDPVYPHIRYRKYTTSWQPIEELRESIGYRGMYPAIAIDNNDYVHVIWESDGYHAGSSYHLVYMRYTTSWQPYESLDVYGEPVGRASIAVESNGDVHIVGNKVGGGIMHKERTSSGWQASYELESMSSFLSSIAIDSNNYIHIVWEYNGNIKYKKYTTSWQSTETIISDTDSTAPYLLWSYYPVVNGIHPNIPQTGYAFIWNDVPIIKFYKSPDLMWETGNQPTDWWPMYRHDLTHSGYSTSTGPETNNVLWTYTTGGSVVGSPAIFNGFVYIGSNDDKFYCLNTDTGALKWVYPSMWRVRSTPTVLDNKMYIADFSGKVYSLNADTGALIWSYTTAYSQQIQSSPAVYNGKVYIGTFAQSTPPTGKVYCLNADTGALIWTYTPGAGIHQSSPAIANGKVYIGSDDSKLYCLNADTGALTWSFTTGSYISSSPAIDNGKVYIGSADNKAYCLNADTGALIWSYTTGSAVTSSPAVANGKVYIGSNDKKLYCLNADTGALIWSYTTGGQLQHSSPAVADDKVYIGSYDYKVYCLNADTGALVWTYTTGNINVVSSPAVADGKVYIGSNDNKVYCFGSGNQPPNPPDYFSQDWVEKVLDWASEQIGKNYWMGYCMGFVSDAFKVCENRPVSANELRNNLENLGNFYSKDNNWDPPKGSLVFFSALGSYAPYGHIGISLGNRNVIHSYDAVRSDSIEDIESLYHIDSYLGWAYPQEGWFSAKFSIAFKKDDTFYKKEGWNLRDVPSLYGKTVSTAGGNGKILDNSWNGICNAGYYWWHIKVGDYNGWCVEEGLDHPPICNIELRKDNAEIDQINVEEFFDIYVGDSTDDQGIIKVRFSSDDSQDNNPIGTWTNWYNWDTSEGDWHADTKIKEWSFSTGGDKKVWVEVKDDFDQTIACSANIYSFDDFDKDNIDDLLEEELAEKYFPILRFDSDERCYPTCIFYHLYNSNLCYHTLLPFDDEIVIYGPLDINDVENIRDDNYYMDNFRGSVYNDDIIEDYESKRNIFGNRTYIHVRKDTFEDVDYYVIQYWFYYVFNDGFWNNHEGDWEMIQVVLDEQFNPSWVVCSQHNGGERREWYNIESEGYHPVIYVALGAHANYFETFWRNRYMDTTDGDGEKLSIENMESIILGERNYHITSQNWLDYEGLWGDWGKVGWGGPQGPMYRWNGTCWDNPAEWALESKKEVWVRCPVNMTISDSKSRKIGLINGEFVNEIPGASADILGDNEFYYLPFDLDYTYEVRAYSEGSYNLTINNEEYGIFFNATNIPLDNDAVHKYIIDWDALSQCEEGVTIQIDNNGDGIFERTIASDSILTQDEFLLLTSTTIDIDPNTMNKNSSGNWITCYIELPQGFNIFNITISLIKLNDIVPAQTQPYSIGDYDYDGILDLMVKFSRPAIAQILPYGNNVEIKVSGTLADGTEFEGIDYIKVV